MTDESQTRAYWAGKQRMNILGASILVGVAGAFVLVATQILDAPWSAWWVIPGGLSLGFLIALASSTLMEYTLGKAYERVDLPFWQYVLVRFRFLFVLFIVPTALALLGGIIYFSLIPAQEGGSLLRWVLPRALTFLVIVLFAGYALPYLFRRAAGAEGTESKRLRSIVSEVAEEMGVSVQGVYEAPLEVCAARTRLRSGSFEDGRACLSSVSGRSTSRTRRSRQSWPTSSRTPAVIILES